MMDEEPSIRRRLAAILAADIAGYSRLMGQDETATVRDLKGHQAVILPLVGRHGGHIIDTAGDGILAEFPSVIGATECAVEIQSVMAARNEDVPKHRRMVFRIGINLGDVIHDETRIYGDGINVAARLEGLAEPGGVLVSRAVHDQVQDRLDLAFEDLGERELKNIARPVRVYRVRTPAPMMPLGELIGNSPGMTVVRNEVTRLLRRLGEGRRQPPILIQGETGTGKTVLARAMHRSSARRDGPFVDVNCGAIPEQLLESLLFGHERGAFTDARQARPGYFQQAHRGTLFLDEVALMSDALQAKLLTAIEDKSVRPLGSTRSVPVDVWVVTASNADLAALKRERRFREDLYQRLTVVTLWLPPLRDRGGDVLLLAEHFLDQACREYGVAPLALDAEARAAVLAYHWPGNVRELANVMERAVLFADGPVISGGKVGLPVARADEPRSAGVGLKDELINVERERLRDALRKTNGNLARASKLLGVPRNTLRHRLKKLGLLAELRESKGADAADVSRSGSAAEEPMPTGTRRGPRRLALLGVELVPTSPDRALPGGRSIDLAIDKVQVFGGRIEERSPTGLLASFGLEPMEDAPERAAHTAVALEKAAARARAEGEAVAVNLAIHVGRFEVGFGSGPAVIDLDGMREARGVLDALLGADRDMIVVSEAAVALLERRFELVQLPVAHGSGPRAYRLVGRAQPAQSAGRRMATFVGRRHNLELLESHLAAAMRGQGQVIGVVGDAGIGKSRLVAEFHERMADRDVTYLEGACASYASAIPYLPVIAILRQSCGITESDSAEMIAASVSGRLETLGMNVEESAPYVLQLFGLPEGMERLAALTPEAIRLRTLQTLRRMVLEASRQRPVVLVVEDLHWTDKASVEVLASLAADLPGAPVMFLSTYRPGFRPPWIEKSFATQTALSPLSSEDSLAIVRAVLPGEIPEAVVRIILDKAEGNPFFLEEMCRAVAHDAGSGAIPAVPDTIEEVLLARIQRLADEPRSVLQAAAVLGREFPPELLRSVWRGTGSLDAHVGLLTDLEFLYQRAAGKEPAHVFKHALTQQVAYETLPPGRRRDLHAAAGRALEEAFAARLEEAYDRLAYHYSKTEDAVKAVEYLSRFAERAARGYAHEEAEQAWNEALHHVERLPADVRDRRRLQVILRLPDSLLPLGRIAELLSLLLGERDRLERLRDPALAARYYFILARAYMLGNHSLVADNARRAIAEAERCGDSATMGGAYGVLTVACALSGQAPTGIESGRRAVALLDVSPEGWSLSYACWALGLCCSQTGAFEEAITVEHRALAIAQAIGDPALEASAAWVIGITHAAMGEWDQGIAECRRAVDATRDLLYRAISTGFLGFAYMEKGDAGAAVVALEESIPLVNQFGLKAFEGCFTAFLAEAHRLEGRLDRGEALAEHACLLATEASFGFALGWAQQSLGRMALARGDPAKATARLEQALATFTAAHSRYECARTHMDLAAVWRARGSGDAARRHLEEAHGLISACGAPRYRERVERLAADWGMPIAGASRP